MTSQRQISLVAIDLDGTLVRDGGTADEDVAALREVLQRGLHVCIATGRPRVSALRVLDELGLEPLPIISFNGAMITLPGEPEPIVHVTLPAELAAEVVEASVEHRWHLHYFLGDDMYVSRVSKKAWEYWRRTGVKPIPAGDLRKLAGREPTKIIVVEEPDRVDDIEPELQQAWGDRLYIARSRPDIVEIVNPEVNKGAALHKLAEHLQVPVEATLGIGDAANDAPLVEAAGVGVAMPGSAPEVLAVADVVLEDGPAPVAEALRKLVLESPQ